MRGNLVPSATPHAVWRGGSACFHAAAAAATAATAAATAAATTAATAAATATATLGGDGRPARGRRADGRPRGAAAVAAAAPPPPVDARRAPPTSTAVGRNVPARRP